MLIDFEFANFRSFRDNARLSLEAIPAFKEYEKENLVEVPRHRLLKSAAIYGPNASGKSNLIKALDFMKFFIVNSLRESLVDEKISVSSFKLDVATLNSPSRFQVILLDKEKLFRYGFEVDSQAVRAEWLFVTDMAKSRARERALFLREDNVFDIRNGIKDKKALSGRTRENVLFLSAAAQWNEPTARHIMSLLDRLRVISGTRDVNYQKVSFEMLQNLKASQRERLLELIRMADLGIDNIVSKERELKFLTGNKKDKGAGIFEQRVLAEHSQYKGSKKIGTVVFDLENEESEGTKKYFRILGPILDTLEKGYTLFLDELEAKLHPSLTRAVVRLFHSPEINSRNAQIIFCTHDTSLLAHSKLRRDQIWFVEKSEKGASTLYPLSDFKNVRKDHHIEKNYIDGRYGAIPFLGGQDVLANLLKN